MHKLSSKYLGYEVLALIILANNSLSMWNETLYINNEKLQKSC